MRDTLRHMVVAMPVFGVILGLQEAVRLPTAQPRMAEVEVQTGKRFEDGKLQYEFPSTTCWVLGQDEMDIRSRLRLDHYVFLTRNGSLIYQMPGVAATLTCTCRRWNKLDLPRLQVF
jgi:hypothetical protein